MAHKRYSLFRRTLVGIFAGLVVFVNSAGPTYAQDELESTVVTTSESVPAEPSEDVEPIAEVIEVVPEAPTATAEECGVRPSIAVPTVGGVEYIQEVAENTVTVTAVAKDGYVFPQETVTSWAFAPAPCAAETERAAAMERAAATPAKGTMTAQGGMEIGPATVTGTTNATIESMVRTPTLFQKAIVTVTADNVSLEAWSKYYFQLSELQQGFEIGRRIVFRSPNKVTVEFYPMQDGKQIESMYVAPGGVASVNAQLGADATNVNVDVTLYGTKFKRTEPAPSDKFDYLEDPFPNPALPAKCGQTVAIVFDLSTSMVATPYGQKTGTTLLKEAGQNAIDALAGTATQVALFNFGTYADRWPSALQKEPLALNDPNNVTTLKNKIATFTQIPPLVTQGTNWEDALQSVINTGTHFDAVYFVTDGIPTHSNEDMPDTDTGNYVTHTEDLNAAIKKANELKRAQTHLEVIGMFISESAREFLLRGVHPNGVYPNKDVGAADNWSKGQYYLGGKRATVAADVSDKRIYSPWTKGDVNVYTKDGKVEGDSTKWSDASPVLAQYVELFLGKNEGSRINNNSDPKNNSYAYSLGVDQTNFGADLRAKLLEGCSGKLIVNKTLVDRHGKILWPGENWTFNAESADGAAVIRNGANGLNEWKYFNSVGKATSKAGSAEFDIKASGDQQMKIAEVIPENSGYQLYKQGGKNAVCHIVTGDPSTGSTTYTPVEVTDDADSATGFKVTLPFDQQMQGVKTVSCEVQNYKDSSLELKLKKVDYQDKTVPLNGAEFTVYAADENFQRIDKVVAEMKDADDEGYLTAELEPDTPYYLVETRSPAGYMLLAQPVLFKIVVEDGKPTVKFYTVVNGKLQEDTANPIAGATENSSSTTPTTNIAFMYVADVHQGELPKTGGLGVWSFALAGALICGFAARIARSRMA